MQNIRSATQTLSK